LPARRRSQPQADSFLEQPLRLSERSSLGKKRPRKPFQMADMFKKRLSECLEKGEDGRLKMTIDLPDESVLTNMAKSLARILGTGWKQ